MYLRPRVHRVAAEVANSRDGLAGINLERHLSISLFLSHHRRRRREVLLEVERGLAPAASSVRVRRPLVAAAAVADWMKVVVLWQNQRKARAQTARAGGSRQGLPDERAQDPCRTEGLW